MAVACKHCGSTDTQAGLNSWMCLHCGKTTPMVDVPTPKPPEE